MIYRVVLRLQDHYPDKRLPHSEDLAQGDYPVLGDDGKLKPFDQIAKDHQLDSTENMLINWLDNYGNGGLVLEMSMREFDAQCGGKG